MKKIVPPKIKHESKPLSKKQKLIKIILIMLGMAFEMTAYFIQEMWFSYVFVGLGILLLLLGFILFQPQNSNAQGPWIH